MKEEKEKKKCEIKYHAIYGGKKFNSLCLTDIFCIRTFSFVKLFSEIDTFFPDINKKIKWNSHYSITNMLAHDL